MEQAQRIFPSVSHSLLTTEAFNTLAATAKLKSEASANLAAAVRGLTALAMRRGTDSLPSASPE